MRHGVKAFVALVVSLGAVCIWIPRFWPGSVPSEASLRDTTNISAAVMGVQVAEAAYRVRCNVVNQSRRTAEQIVLKVALLDSAGGILAINPLANAAFVMPGETREVTVLVPMGTRIPNVRATIDVSLVRWEHD